MSRGICGCAAGHGANDTVQLDRGKLKSRLRNYFTLRCQLGGEYLGLLQFFLNHDTSLRSRVAEREGKIPKQLMTGKAHPHCLTFLGFGQPKPLRA